MSSSEYMCLMYSLCLLGVGDGVDFEGDVDLDVDLHVDGLERLRHNATQD
jgi:hypothetical protein